MKSEIIIAVRGELPRNLERTVEEVRQYAPVCVVYDGEERGNEVLPSIARTCRVERVSPRPMGCGYARHVGIMSSKADLIVIMDGHMRIIDDKWWLAIQTAHKRATKKLSCCMMQSLDQHGDPMPDKPQKGAFLALKTREVLGNRWAISAKWNDADTTEPGPVSAVMGACYAMRRDWYVRMGCPLSILCAWGGDEEVLSLSTHIMGGSVHLLDATVGHIYMASHTGRVRDADEDDAIWLNRHSIVEAMPMTQEERADLLAWMRQSPRMFRRDHVAMMRDRDILSTVHDLRDTLSTGPRSFADLVRSGIVRELTDAEQAKCLGADPGANDAKRYVPPPAPSDDVTQVIQRKATVCERCNALDSFRQIAGRRHAAAFAIAYARCYKCGHKAQIRTLTVQN